MWRFAPCGISPALLIAGPFLMTEAGATFTCEASPPPPLPAQLAVPTFPAIAPVERGAEMVAR